MSKASKRPRSLRDGSANAFIFLCEERGHKNVGDRPHAQPEARPRHHQTGDGEGGAEAGVEEAEAQPYRGDGHRRQEDDVDVLAVKPRL